MALVLSRGQIIEEGLSLAGRTDLKANARLWLNLFLEQQYMNQDFGWLIKTLTGLAATQGLSFPKDYRAGKVARIFGVQGGSHEVDVIDNPDLYAYKRVGVDYSTSMPGLVYADHNLRKFYFLPEPSQAFNWELSYYYIPVLPDHTDISSDDDLVKWGLPAQILIDHIKMRAYEHNDDQRYTSTKQEISGDIAAAKANNHDRRAGPSRMSMGKRFRKRF